MGSPIAYSNYSKETTEWHSFHEPKRRIARLKREKSLAMKWPIRHQPAGQARIVAGAIERETQVEGAWCYGRGPNR